MHKRHSVIFPFQLKHHPQVISFRIRLVDFYDFGGNRGKGLQDGSIVIRFQTVSAEPDG